MGGKANPGKNNCFEIKIPPNYKHLSEVRIFIKKVAQKKITSDNMKFDNLQLCVSEAVANSISAHNLINSKSNILIKLVLHQDRIEAEIKDKGRGFKPKGKSARRWSLGKLKLKEKGMGLRLINEYSDNCEIKSSSKGTSIRISILC